MEAIPKFDIKSVIKSDIKFEIRAKLTTWIGHKSLEVQIQGEFQIKVYGGTILKLERGKNFWRRFKISSFFIRNCRECVKLFSFCINCWKNNWITILKMMNCINQFNLQTFFIFSKSYEIFLLKNGSTVSLSRLVQFSVCVWRDSQQICFCVKFQHSRDLLLLFPLGSFEGSIMIGLL